MASGDFLWNPNGFLVSPLGFGHSPIWFPVTDVVGSKRRIEEALLADAGHLRGPERIPRAPLGVIGLLPVARLGLLVPVIDLRKAPVNTSTVLLKSADPTSRTRNPVESRTYNEELLRL